MINLKAQYTEAVLDILSSVLHHGEVVKAFGSRVKGTHHQGSDLDLVVFAEQDVSKEIRMLKGLFHDSNIPIFVQIHEWNRLPSTYQSNINEHALVFFEAPIKG